MMIESRQADLVSVLDRQPALVIAVSGGVDSMVLSFIAHRFSRTAVTAVHAVSPAVPMLATERVKRHATRHGWTLKLIDAEELSDPSYRNNPVDRCFYCKTNLYARIRAETDLPIASGTNCDDLGDYRPGLDAARHYQVLHPFVEARIGKADIYALAKAHGLSDLAALPAQPCLASRIETGIGVDAASLRFIEEAEAGLAARLPGRGALRCRITASGVYVECEVLPLGQELARVESWVGALCGREGRIFAGFRAYRRGAAFLRAAE
jgi:uncharacterized protein